MTIMGLIQLLILILVVGILCWLAFWILAQFAPPDPIGRIIKVIIVVIAVVILVLVLLNIGGIGTGTKLVELQTHSVRSTL